MYHPLLTDVFSGLEATPYKITSPVTRSYNCIAFAAEDDTRWWWPADDTYWPSNVPKEETLESFIKAFEMLGYAPCENGELEPNYKKVAIYTDKQNTPTHMARQLPSGSWVSKCGGLEDIEHVLEGLEGDNEYGKVTQFLKKPA
jgi:hypothetical protein